MISFTIKCRDSYQDYTYYAEEGMTWREWINSDYNTDRYSIIIQEHIEVITCPYSNHGSHISTVTGIDGVIYDNYEYEEAISPGAGRPDV